MAGGERAGRDPLNSLGPADPAAFFDASVRQFEATTGPTMRFTVAGRSVDVLFSSASLAARVAPSLMAGDAAGEAVVTIHAGTAAEVQLPHPSWQWSEYGQRGEIASLSDGSYRASFHRAVPTFSMLDSTRMRGLYWAGTTQPLPHFEAGSPFLHLVHWSLQRFGMQLVHGAAIGRSGSAALLAGPGGSGKTTTALAMAMEGMDYIGDDYCAIDPSRMHVLPVFTSGKIFPSDVARIHGIERFVRQDDNNGEKLLLDMRPQTANVAHALRILLLPSFHGGAGCVAERISAAQALLALAPSTMFQLSGARSAAFETMSHIVRRIPAYRLRIGSDAPATRNTIEQLLSAEVP